jgi:hypothetical protein
MSTAKRPRGRPRGSGKNDSAELACVADLLVKEPSLSAAAAMKRVIGGRQGSETPETLLRRLQVKWKQQKESLLAAAKERARPKISSGVVGYSRYPLTATGRFEAQYQRMIEMQRLIDRQMEVERYFEVQRILDRQKEVDRILEVQRMVDRQREIDRSLGGW